MSLNFTLRNLSFGRLFRPRIDGGDHPGNTVKNFVALAAMATSCAAWAHRPHIVDCATFAAIAHEAAEVRDNNKPLQDAMTMLDSGHRWDNYIETYRVLVRDVYTDSNLRGVSPTTLYKAAEKSCLAHNDEERRTRELY